MFDEQEARAFLARSKRAAKSGQMMPRAEDGEEDADADADAASRTTMPAQRPPLLCPNTDAGGEGVPAGRLMLDWDLSKQGLVGDGPSDRSQGRPVLRRPLTTDSGRVVSLIS